MKIYNYNNEGIFTGESLADIDPLESNKQGKPCYLLPRNATFDIPPIPSEKQIVRRVNDAWIIEDIIDPEPILPTLEQSKINKINQLNINREAFCLIPIEYQGKTYATTLEAKASISGLISLLPNASSTSDYFTYPEGEAVTLTKTDFKAIGEKIQNREVGSRKKRNDLTIEINNALTIEELQNININFE